ncbi:beta-N-acetylhexosaminidase [Microbacterium saperdae]|uniref:beta-N-acetylhexosaminidase n=1 Tax=Microbacterium saperdae TaxID=69368 RepID=A0A543BIN7_9MICO|nr:beta-N-acetylhexosaminidase [Microbacterium saperdae]TQL84722.1 hexosaminidase [Microbacterium saperdae]GGM64656.1 beta-N-acetylhexosaminidase [Microbacterium saperdae]
MTIHIVPRPVSLVECEEPPFVLDSSTRISADAGLGDAAQLLGELLRPATGLPLTVGDIGGIRFLVDQSLADEEYRVAVDAQSILVHASGRRGALHAVQTIRQLLPAEAFSPELRSGIVWSVPAVRIADRPALSWRGAHLDTARHFMPPEFVHRFIDLIALHKFNRFHLHLTEDQGWRIEIPAYPRLTEVAAWRDGTVRGRHVPPWSDDLPHDGIRHGGFYTRADLEGFVAHAARLGIDVLPEIEMPGHAQAAIAAYPWLGNGTEVEVGRGWGVSPHVYSVSDRTLQFCRDVLEVVFEIFPFEFVHLGADECPKDEWRASAEAQQRMREEGLADEDELQSWFLSQITAFVHERGRRVIGWDEILEGGLPPAAAVMSWRGEEGGLIASALGHDVVMAPQENTYFDFYQGDEETEPLAHGPLLDLAAVRAYQPVPAGIPDAQRSRILGSQFQLWSEYLSTTAQVEYMAFPRACVFADVVWGTPDDGTFLTDTLPAHLERLEQLDVNFRRLDVGESA